MIRPFQVTKDNLGGSVWWGTNPSSLTSTASATTTTYTVDDMCGSPANSVTGWMNPGVINTAKMTGLGADTLIYYKVGAGSSVSDVKVRFSDLEGRKQSETLLEGSWSKLTL